MKLVSFAQNGRHGYGVLIDGMVVDLQAAAPDLPGSVIALLEAGAETLAQADAVARRAGPEHRIPIAQVQRRAPIPHPGKIICVGLNYKDHAAESNAELPAYPTIFAKYGNTVSGPYDPIVLPRVTDQVDYEGELGVVIGRRVRGVSESEALRSVAGYLIVNDVSARDYQMRTSQWTVGKSFDGFAPMGPALVTADEIPDPQNLDLRVRIGGEVLQSANTSHMIFSVARIISYLTEAMTLEPGDVIATGTPAGVGAARTPPRFLAPGDIVHIEITGLGSLDNPVVAE